MPFWKKKKPKQQKSTAKSKPAVAPVKPLPKVEVKQRPYYLPPKYEPPKMPDYILKKIGTEKRYHIVHDSTEEIRCKKGISKSVRTAYHASSGMGCMERFCGDACLRLVESG